MRFLKAITAAKQNPFLRMNMVFFVGSLLVAFLNYLYYPILGRLLSAEQFGELQVLVSFFLQATILLSVLSLVIVNILTGQLEKEEKEEAIIELERGALLIGGAVFFLSAVTSPIFASALRFSDTSGFIVIAAVFFVSIPLAFRTAFLRGFQDFKAASLAGIIGSVIKLAASVGLVYAGQQAFGAVLGILLAQACALIYAGRAAAGYGFPHAGWRPRWPAWRILRPHMKFITFVFFVSLAVTALFSIDVIVVKYFFSPEVAGAYAGISTIARIVYFLTASIAIVLLSSVSVSAARDENMRMLRKSFLLTCLTGGLTTLLFVLFPEFVTHVLMGHKYDAYIHLLPLLSLAMFVVSLANVAVNYTMAVRDYGVTAAVICATILTVGLMAWRHMSVDEIVQNLLIAGVVLCIMLALRIGKTGRRSV